MTNTKLKRKAKQIAVLVEMGIITIDQVKRKVKPQFYQDYIFPLLKERYIPLTYLRMYGADLQSAISADIISAQQYIRTYKILEKDNKVFGEFADIHNALRRLEGNNTITTADQMHQKMQKGLTEAQQKIKFYCETFPTLVKTLISTGEIK